MDTRVAWLMPEQIGPAAEYWQNCLTVSFHENEAVCEIHVIVFRNATNQKSHLVPKQCPTECHFQMVKIHTIQTKLTQPENLQCHNIHVSTDSSVYTEIHSQII